MPLLAPVWPGGFVTRPIAEFARSRAVRSRGPWRRSSLKQREVMLHLDLDAATTRCRSLLTSLGDERPADEVAEGTVLEAVTHRGWKSFGTVLRIELEPARDGTKATITGWPGAQLFDYGESKGLVNRIAEALAVEGHS